MDYQVEQTRARQILGLLADYREEYARLGPCLEPVQEFAQELAKASQKQLALGRSIRFLEELSDSVVLSGAAQAIVESKILSADRTFFQVLDEYTAKWNRLQHLELDRGSVLYRSLEDNYRKVGGKLSHLILAIVEDRIWNLEFEQLRKVAAFMRGQTDFKQFREQIYKSRRLAVLGSISPMLNQLSYSPDVELGQFYQFLLESLLIHVQIEKDFIDNFESGLDPDAKHEVLKFVCQPIYEAFPKLAHPLHSVEIGYTRLDAILEVSLRFRPKLEALLRKVDNLATFISTVRHLIAEAIAKKQKELVETKFNIHVLSNYEAVREQLKGVRQRVTSRSESDLPEPLTSAAELLSPFVKFMESRPLLRNNKSVIVFNLNLATIYWEQLLDLGLTYKDVPFGEHLSRTIDEAKNLLVLVNLFLFKEKYLKEETSNPKKDLLDLLELNALPQARSFFDSDSALLISRSLIDSVRKNFAQILQPIYERAVTRVFGKGEAGPKEVEQKCAQLGVSKNRFGKYGQNLGVKAFAQLFG